MADRRDDLLDPRVDIGVARTALQRDAADRAVLENDDREDRLTAPSGEEYARQQVEVGARQGDQAIEIVAACRVRTGDSRLARRRIWRYRRRWRRRGLGDRGSRCRLDRSGLNRS